MFKLLYTVQSDFARLSKTDEYSTPFIIDTERINLIVMEQGKGRFCPKVLYKNENNRLEWIYFEHDFMKDIKDFFKDNKKNNEMDKKIEDIVAQNERDAERHEQYKNLKRHIFNFFAKGENSFGTRILMAQYHVEDLMISWGTDPEKAEFDDDFNIGIIDKCLYGTQMFGQWEEIRKEVVHKKGNIWKCLDLFLKDLDFERRK